MNTKLFAKRRQSKNLDENGIPTAGPKEMVSSTMFSDNRLKHKSDCKLGFGVPLAKLCEDTQTQVPLVVEVLCEYCTFVVNKDDGSSVDYHLDIFHNAMTGVHIKTLQDECLEQTSALQQVFDLKEVLEKCSPTLRVPENTNVYIALGLLKLFTLMLPEAVLPDLASELMSKNLVSDVYVNPSCPLDSWTSSTMRSVILKHVENMPSHAKYFLRYLIRFLRKLYYYAEEEGRKTLAMNFSSVLIKRDLAQGGDKDASSSPSPRSRSSIVSLNGGGDKKAARLAHQTSLMDLIPKMHEAFIELETSLPEDSFDHNLSVIMQVLFVHVDTLFETVFTGNIRSGTMSVKPHEGVWDTYYCVLKDDLFYILEDQHSENIIHLINLDKVISVRPVDASLFGVDACFLIEREGRGSMSATTDVDNHSPRIEKYYFRPVNDDWSEWVQAVDMAVTKVCVNSRFSCRELKSLSLGINSFAVEKSHPLASSFGKFEYYCNIYFKDDLQGRTFPKKPEDSAVVDWMASFVFQNIRFSSFDVTIVLYKVEKKGKDTELGRLVVPFNSFGEKDGNSWYVLENGMGKVRLEVRYIVERIGPSWSYKALHSYMMDLLSMDTEKLSSIFNVLNKSTTASLKNKLALFMIRFYLGTHKHSEFLKRINMVEIFTTPNESLIFRGNTVATKCMDQYMKLTCLQYLRDVLGDVCIEVFNSKDSCDIDPKIVEKASEREKNLKRLKGYIASVFDRILDSAPRCPVLLCDILESLRRDMEKRFTEDLDEAHALTAVSGFIFLRLFSAALQGPHLLPFSLVPDIPSEKSRRTFTLLSKTVQTLANLRLFSEKDSYMQALNDFLEEKDFLPRMKVFLFKLSSVSTAIKPYSRRRSLNFDIDRALAGIHLAFVEAKPSFEENLKIMEKEGDSEGIANLQALLEVVQSVEDSKKNGSEDVLLKVGSKESEDDNRSLANDSTEKEVETLTGKLGEDNGLATTAGEDEMVESNADERNSKGPVSTKQSDSAEDKIEERDGKEEESKGISQPEASNPESSAAAESLSNNSPATTSARRGRAGSVKSKRLALADLSSDSESDMPVVKTDTPISKKKSAGADSDSDDLL
eukprot:Nk52_evm16s246 gene=Nk52_evmTU16s246